MPVSMIFVMSMRMSETGLIFLASERLVVSVGHMRIGITNPGEVGCTWTRIQVAQYRIVAVTFLQLGNLGSLVEYVAKGNCIRRAYLLAGCLDCTIRNSDFTGTWVLGYMVYL